MCPLLTVSEAAVSDGWRVKAAQPFSLTDVLSGVNQIEDRHRSLAGRSVPDTVVLGSGGSGARLEKDGIHQPIRCIVRSSIMRKKKGLVLPASVLPRLRVMCGQDAALGPGRVQLLELIGETGSLRSAAVQMGMAYMTAWTHVKTLNRRFRSPVVVAKRGGKVGGGAVLTKMGQRVVALYHRMEEQSHAAIQEGFREFRSLLKP